MSFLKSKNNRDAKEYDDGDVDDDNGKRDEFPFGVFQDPNDEFAREVLDLTDLDLRQGDDDDKKTVGSQSKTKSYNSKIEIDDNIEKATTDTLSRETEQEYVIPTVRAVLVTDDVQQSQTQQRASPSSSTQDFTAKDMHKTGREIAQSLQSSTLAQNHRTPPATTTRKSSTTATPWFGASGDGGTIAGTSSSVDNTDLLLLEIQRNKASVQQRLEEKEHQHLNEQQQHTQLQQQKQRRRKCILLLLLLFVLVGVTIATSLVMGGNRIKEHEEQVHADTAPPSAAPITGPKFKAIQTTQDLYKLVDLWLNGSFTSDSIWAGTYGYPIGQWDVSQITDFSYLFAACNYSTCSYPENRNSLAVTFTDDISMWNVSKAKNMSHMFESAVSFNNNLSQWNVGSVVDMSMMFSAAVFFNGDISKWNVANAVDMSYMFFEARSFNGDLSQWNVASIEEMSGMFANAYSFSGDISQWDVGNVKNMRYMFSNANSFNGDISPWNVANVEDMNSMFYEADLFDQNLCDWASLLSSTAITYGAFEATLCPNVTDPDLSSNPKGPFCYNCI